MAERNWVKFEFPSDTRNVAFARTAVALFASQLDWTLDELEDIKVAVSEAVSNSIIHGYQLGAGIVRVEVEYEGSKLTIVVEDYGQGIPDVAQAQETGFTTIPEERMGLGFTFMHEYMDEVLVSSEVQKGTKVILIKEVPQRPEG
ncbi:MAG TPA: anti-sigma F factor [Firmicutes bacterium]|jgi:stage II sporulation protein AB (anti-sigma F factor)|nr:anti-sigma F factor [Bacillota bacterium]